MFEAIQLAYSFPMHKGQRSTNSIHAGEVVKTAAPWLTVVKYGGNFL